MLLVPGYGNEAQLHGPARPYPHSGYNFQRGCWTKDLFQQAINEINCRNLSFFLQLSYYVCILNLRCPCDFYMLYFTEITRVPEALIICNRNEIRLSIFSNVLHNKQEIRSPRSQEMSLENYCTTLKVLKSTKSLALKTVCVTRQNVTQCHRFSAKIEKKKSVMEYFL